MRELFVVLLSVFFLGLTACERSSVIYNSFQESVDAEIASLDAADFTYTGADNRDHITDDFTLPTTGREGTTITWTSSHPQYVIVTGGNADVIARPAYFEGDFKVTLTATVSVEGASGTTEIVVVVAAEETHMITQKYVSDPSVQVGDNFGYSVSISGDHVIAGVPYQDLGGLTTDEYGAAYIFERNTLGNWNQVQKLNATPYNPGDEFGCSVAVSGDYAIVGAHNNDDYGNNAGLAYIFERDIGGTWNQVQILYASNYDVDDEFGYSVAISGDYAIVAAYNYSGSSGAIYIFEREGGTWNEKQTFTAESGGDYYGESVSISGNYAIVGAYFHDPGGVSNAGAAYIIERDAGGNWNQVQKLTADIPAVNENFGNSVSISGNYAIVGAFQNIDLGFQAGAAYIFERNTSGNWNRVQKLTASNGGINDRFGTSVSINRGFAVIGAPYEDDISNNDNGAIYVFKRNNSGSWYEDKIIRASPEEDDAYFGFYVSISEDSVIVGAHMEDSGATDGGAIYILY